jgi:hypothetical protein
MRHVFIVLCAILAAQEARANELPPASDTQASRVFTFDIRPDREKELSRYIDSLMLAERQQRAIELQVIHENPLTKVICELSKFTPYRFKPEVDTFFLQNYMRRDFNPVDEDQLVAGVRPSKPRFSVRIGR